MRFSTKIGLAFGALLLLVGGTTSAVLLWRQERVQTRSAVARDHALARVLAALRDEHGATDFATIAAVVDIADRCDIGLVYALELGAGKRLRRGRINPRSFTALDGSYHKLLLGGRHRALEALAADKVDRAGVIKEYRFRVDGGILRLGFGLGAIDRQLARERRVAIGVVGGGVLLGLLGVLLVARRLARPLSQLAAAAAGGDGAPLPRAPGELGTLATAHNRALQDLAAKGGLSLLLERYLSRPIAARLMSAEDPLQLPVEERPVTVVSLRLCGHAEQARGGAPRAALALLNEYLAPILDAVLAEGGVVFALDGAALQLVWGAPDDARDGELSAIRGALAAREAVRQEGRRQRLAGRADFALRGGICTGRAALGNIGSAERTSLAVVGEAVELAREIEALAEPDELLISEATFNKVIGAVNAAPCSPLILDGMEEALPLYRVSAT